MTRTKFSMRPTSGDYFVGAVRVGGWRQTAKDVIHADTITGLSGQYATRDDVDNAVFASVVEWLTGLLEPNDEVFEVDVGLDDD